MEKLTRKRKLYLPLRRRGVIIAMRMKKKSANKTLLLVLPALLLSGCGKSLSRLDAATLLGNVVSYVGSSEFETPKSWTIEETGKGKLSNGSLSYEGSFSSAHHYSEEDHYFHSTLSVEGKVGAALSLKYTSEEWIYIDLMAPNRLDWKRKKTKTEKKDEDGEKSSDKRPTAPPEYPSASPVRNAYGVCC